MYLFTSQMSLRYSMTNYYYYYHYCQIALLIGLQSLLFGCNRCTPGFLVLQTGFEMAKSDFDILCKGTALPLIFLRAVDDTHLPLPHRKPWGKFLSYFNQNVGVNCVQTQRCVLWQREGRLIPLWGRKKCVGVIAKGPFPLWGKNENMHHLCIF